MAHRRKPTRTLAQRGELTAETDPRRPSGRFLRQCGMDASYIDLADPRHLEFDYMRWLRIILLVADVRRVLHVGGGACALARALAAQWPGMRQEVCEVDGDVLALAREHFGLRRAPGLRVRHAEGRACIAAQADASWDAIVVDAFEGARVPGRLISAEALADAGKSCPDDARQHRGRPLGPSGARARLHHGGRLSQSLDARPASGKHDRRGVHLRR